MNMWDKHIAKDNVVIKKIHFYLHSACGHLTYKIEDSYSANQMKLELAISYPNINWCYSGGDV